MVDGESSPDVTDKSENSVAVSVKNLSGKSSRSGLTHSLTIKLDDKNFLLWSQQVNGVITAHNLHHFVLNPKIPLEFFTEEDRAQAKVSDEYRKWLMQDQTLFTWLLSTLSDGVLPRVLGCRHAFQVWDKVHRHFNSLLKARARQLRSELKNTKKASRSIGEYLLRIKAIVDSLIAISDSITDQDHIDAILEGLPEEYNSFVMMIYGHLDSPSVEDLESLLMVQEAQFEKFRQELAKPSVSANVAHTNLTPAESTQNSVNSNPTPEHPGFQGFGCGRGRFNGRGRGRFDRDNGNFGRGYGGPRLQCQICGMPGHEAIRCWFRYDQNAPAQHMPYTQPRPSQFQVRPTANLAFQQFAPTPQEFMMSAAPANQAWYPDSGASHHLAFNQQNLQHQAPYNGQEQVLMGNGQGL